MVGLLITDPPERIDARTWGATSSQPIGIRPHRLTFKPDHPMGADHALRPACAKLRSTERGNPPRARPRSGQPAAPSWHRDRDNARRHRRPQAAPFLSLATKPAGCPPSQSRARKRSIFRGAHTATMEATSDESLFLSRTTVNGNKM